MSRPTTIISRHSERNHQVILRYHRSPLQCQSAREGEGDGEIVTQERERKRSELS